MIVDLTGHEARKKVLAGMKRVADPVAWSMGAAGRNTLREDADRNPWITKDGASIARAIAGQGLVDRFENLGSWLIKKASENTEEDAGDGTSQATILTYALCKMGMMYMDRGVNAIKIREGMHRAFEAVKSHLESQSKEAKDKEAWKQVAYVSSQDEEIAEIVSTAMDSVKDSSFISVLEGDDWADHEMELKYKKGLLFYRGWAWSQCMTAPFEEGKTKLENVPILVTDRVLETKEDERELMRICNSVVKELGLPSRIVLIAPEFKEYVKKLVLINNDNINFRRTDKEGNPVGYKIVAIKVPGSLTGVASHEEFCKDVCALTGATFVSKNMGMDLKNINHTDLGRCESIESDKSETIIINNNADEQALQDRVDAIDALLKNEKGDYSKKQLKKRKACLTTGLATIIVGGHVDTAIQEKQDRVEDAVLAVQCALDEGVVPGGGVAFIKSIPSLTELLNAEDDEDIRLGIKIVGKALEQPCRQLVDNAGESGEAIVREIKKMESNTKGYNLRKGFDDPVDMMKEGIVDPAKVSITALRYAVEVASTFLTTECAVVQVPVDNDLRFIKEGLPEETFQN